MAQNSNNFPVLWHRPARASRGPQPAHTREDIAAVAIRIADAEGIEAVSMRRIAAEMGAGTASLYRYIAKKEEIFDLMFDVVIGEEPLPKARGDWRTRLREFAWRARALYLRHPWMFAVSNFRTPLGPNRLSWFEFTMRAIDGLGLNIDEMLVFNNTWFTFVRGCVTNELAEKEADRRSGLSGKQWLATQAEYVRTLIATGEYPMFARVVLEAKAPHDTRMAERGFDRGLNYILDGLAVRIAKASAQKPKASRGKK